MGGIGRRKMDKHFYPERGAEAWPDGCPSCGEPVREYSPESDATYTYWQFACRAEIVLNEEGLPEVNDDCPDAMQRHLEGLIIHTADPTP
jgi:hypothetical protein